MHTWAFAIGTGDLRGDVAARYARYSLVVVDGEEVTAAQVRALQANGTVVLAYLDVGTIEPYRAWYGAAKPYRLDYWKQWGEWYADVAVPGYRTLMVHRVAPAMLAKGVDGLFLDNVDMIETHRAQRSAMTTLVHTLALAVHRRHGFLFAQNGADVIGPMLHDLDGWNREDASTAQAGTELRAIRAHGLLTLATVYRPHTDTRVACAAGALPFVSNVALTSVPVTPAEC